MATKAHAQEGRSVAAKCIMKITYVSFTRLPGEKAHSLYMAKAAEAFGELGHQTSVWVPRRFGVPPGDPYVYYGVVHAFAVRRLFCIDLLPLPAGKALWHKLGLLTFALRVGVALLFDRSDRLVFTNDAFVALLASFCTDRVVYEIHDYPEAITWWYRQVVTRVYRVLTNNHQKAQRLQQDFAIALEKVIAVHNGVDLAEFDTDLSKEEARKQVHFDQDKPYVVYTGHLYDWKGASTLAEAAKLMPTVKVVFVGGTEEDVVRLRTQYQDVTNIHFLGHRPHADIPTYLKAADVLVLPNSGKHDLSLYHTSPMKLFEYMASGRPIVASNIPAITEILNENNAILVLPDDPQALAAGIREALRAPNTQRNRQAFNDVHNYTWTRRAQDVLKHLIGHE